MIAPSIELVHLLSIIAVFRDICYMSKREGVSGIDYK